MVNKNFFDHNYPVTKMHGLGNDFVVYADFEERTTPDDVRKVCAFHTGVGADGVITVTESRTPKAKYRMKYFNADGSSGEMCGNGIRCFAKYLYDNKLMTKKGEFSVDTDAGIIVTDIFSNTKKEAIVRVNMRKPVLENPDQVTKKAEKDGLIHFRFLLKNNKGIRKRLDGVYVGMGNPHAVFFVKRGNTEKSAREFGPQIEAMISVFPQKTNVEFVKVNNRKNLTMHVWERNIGSTMACGTGACATLVAAVLHGYADRSAKVHLPGGVLEIVWESNESSVFMTGQAVNTFTITDLNT
jgi:diaminopimelate epimerase